MSLQDDWNRLCASLHLEGEGYWDVLEKSYTENQLAYHNLEHIADCLSIFRRLKHLAENPDAVECAIWFHDIIYDPKAPDNEAQSAQIAAEFVGKTLFSEKVAELILDTKHQGKPETNDGQLICDIDLSILGSDSETYRRYAQAIREEYSWVSPSDYTSGRSKVLESFLNRKKIYSLPEFTEKHENLARRNLTDELADLRPST